MEQINLRAFAKINLFLDVLGKRVDGFHDISSILQSISLADEITLSPDRFLRLFCNDSSLANNDNLALRAARVLREEYRAPGGAVIELTKKIPVGAGLGGGSADAAAVLIGLNRLWNLRLPQEELLRIGANLGADVPFCLMGGTALAQGKGEMLEPLQALPETAVLLYVPPYRVSTSWAYSELDRNGTHLEPRSNQLDQVLKAVERGDWSRVADNLANSFSTVILGRYPDLKRHRKAMLEESALGVGLSGSGPTLFGIRSPDYSSSAGMEIAGDDAGMLIATATSALGVEILD